MFSSADAYDRFMGRYSTPLAQVFADFALIRPGQRVLDVGCGPGALLDELVHRLAPGDISALDPSEPFILAARSRHAGVDARLARAEEIPFPSGTFDASMAQLVVHFMADPVAGLTEMKRVTRPGGVVAACVWDLVGGQGPLATFWEAAREGDPGVDDESMRPGTGEGELGRLFADAGFTSIESAAISTEVEHPSFEEWWMPFTLGIGPAGAYVSTLKADERAALRDRCRHLLPDAPFVITATAWATRGIA